MKRKDAQADGRADQSEAYDKQRRRLRGRLLQMILRNQGRRAGGRTRSLRQGES